VHLHAAFVPPAETLEALTALVRSLEPPPAVPTPAPGADSPRRALFARRAAAPEVARTAPLSTGPMLDVVETGRMLVPITDFGWLTAEDARRVADALTQVCAGLPPAPTIEVRGGSALVDPEDRAVWANVAGTEDDIGAMRAIAAALVSGVEPLGYYRDRRQFKPRFPVATITEATTVEHLERVLATLDLFRGGPWQVSEVTLIQRGSGVFRTLTVAG
jgi:2'-5' RNA ligase